jgi:hypothetical protein
MPFGAGFTPKDWVNEPSPGVPSSTPIDAPALEDLEQRLWDATEDEVAAAMEQAASVEDLVMTASDPGGFTATRGSCFIPIMFPCRIEAAAFVFDGAGITQSDSNFWSILIRRHRAGASPTIVQRTTQTTGGAAITNRVPFNFDTATWDEGNRICAKDDAIDLAWVATGTPAATSRMTFAAHYSPV